MKRGTERNVRGEMRIDDMRVEFTRVQEAPQGVRCSIALRRDNLLDPGNLSPDALKLRRGDKVFLWETVEGAS